MSGRMIWTDYAKAIGIILVVYGHVARGVFNAGMPMDEGLYRLVDSIIYTFHMPLFFFLSGLFFASSFKSRGGASGLVFNKVDTVFYPYLVWSVLQGLVEVVFSNFTNKHIGLSEVFSLLWAPRAQFWFLYALFFVFVASAFYYKFFVFRNRTLLLLVMLFLAYVNDLDSGTLIFENYFSGFMVFFILGVFLSENAGQRFYDAMSTFGSVLVLAALFAFAEYYFHEGLGLSYTNQGFPSFAVAVLGIMFVVSVSGWLAKHPVSWLAYIGASSMAIYVMHIIAGSAVRILLKKVFHVQAVEIQLMVGLAAGLLMPLIAIYAMEKVGLKYMFAFPLSERMLSLWQKVFVKNHV